MVVRDVADDALEGYFRQAGEWTNLRRYGGAGGRSFVDEAHDIVAVSAIVDSGDP